MDRRTVWALVLGAVVLVVVVFLMPLLGLTVLFRREIKDWMRGSAAPGEVVRLTYVCVDAATIGPGAIDRDRRIMESRLAHDKGGCTVRLLDDDSVEIVVSGGPQAADEAMRLLGHAGRLEFRIVVNRQRDEGGPEFDRLLDLRKAGESSDNPAYQWFVMKNGYARAKSGVLDQWGYVYWVDEESSTAEVLVRVDDGQNVTDRDLSRAVGDRVQGMPVVRFDMKEEATSRFQALTRPEMRDRHLAIILDRVVQTAPILKATLSSSGVISGYDSDRETREVAKVLNSGSLTGRWKREENPPASGVGAAEDLPAP
jgi:preprotein translocase subunit SecD